MKKRTLRRRYGHSRASKVLVQEIRTRVKLYRDPKTGIVWIEDTNTGTGLSAHPHIDASGSILGMKKLGYWGKKDRTVRSHGWIYNIDRMAGCESADEKLVRNMCECGGNHGGR